MVLIFKQVLCFWLWCTFVDKWKSYLYTQVPQNAFLITSNCTAPDFNWKFENMKGSHWCLLALLMQKQVPVGFMDRSRKGVLEGSVWALLESFTYLNLHTDVKIYENKPYTVSINYLLSSPPGRKNSWIHTYSIQ